MAQLSAWGAMENLRLRRDFNEGASIVEPSGCWQRRFGTPVCNWKPLPRRARAGPLGLGRTPMEKRPVTPASHREMLRKYPITGLVEGWYFRQQEVSAGCYVVEGSDIYGRTISRQTADPEAALGECVAFARAAVQTGRHHEP